MQYLINSNNFSPDKNFDFQFKDDETISLLMVDENVEEVTEFVCGPDESWYLPFKVGPFIEKTPKNYFKIASLSSTIVTQSKLDRLCDLKPGSKG